MTARACPGCTATMKPFTVEHIELDRCSFCRGLWFDGGELEQVLGKKLSGMLDGSVTSRKCARCNVEMKGAQLGGLRVEVCTTCHGVFLDDGELVALNGGKQVRVTSMSAPQAPARGETEAKDDVMAWLHSLGV